MSSNGNSKSSSSKKKKMSARRRYYFFNKLYNILLSTLLILSLLIAIVSGVVSVTIGNPDYKYTHFTNIRTISTLVDNLENNLTPLCEKEEIPVEVFMNTTNYNFIVSIQRTVVSDTYTEIPNDFSYTSTITYDYGRAIDKYDRENGISRRTDEKNRIVNEAVEIFNETCSIKNYDKLTDYAKVINNNYITLSMVGFIAASVACCFGLREINGRRRRAYNYMAMCFNTAGLLLIAIPSVIYISGIMNRLMLTNIPAYNIAITEAVNLMLIVLAVFGLVLLAGGTALFIWTYKYYRFRLLESDTEEQIKRNLVD